MAKLERLVTPKGVKTISENGEYEIASYESVDVDVTLKASVEGTTLVIPKSTTAAPSMSGVYKGIFYFLLDERNNTWRVKTNIPIEENKTYLIRYYNIEMDELQNFIFSHLGISQLGFLCSTDDDNYKPAMFYTYNAENVLGFMCGIFNDEGSYHCENDFIEVWELPITLPTIEGE